MIFYQFVGDDTPLEEISILRFNNLIGIYKYYLKSFENNLFIFETVSDVAPKFLYCMVIL